MKHTTPVVLIAVTLAVVAVGGLAATAAATPAGGTAATANPVDAGSAGSADVAAAADAAAQSTDTELVTVQIRVRTPDDEPIANAEATFDWEGADDPPSRTTLSDGTFRTDVPQDAEWSMELFHDDYVRNFEFTRSGAEQDEVVDVTMHPPAEPTVTVVDTEGAPIEDADVHFGKAGQSRLAAIGTTDENGEFTPDPIERGDYELGVVAQGYYENETDVEVDGNFSRTVVLEAGTVTLDLLTQDPTPEGPGTIDAQVTFSRGDTQVKQVRTNDAGGRTVSLAVNTEYEVSATSEGYTTTRKAITTGEDREEYPINMTRTPAISLDVGNQKIVVGERLQVTVTDEYDRPVEGATVSLDGTDAGTTDEGGVASVQVDSEGNVSVGSSADGKEAEAVTVEGVPESQSGDGSGNGTGDGSGDSMLPGPGLLGALLAVLLGVAALARRS